MSTTKKSPRHAYPLPLTDHAFDDFAAFEDLERIVDAESRFDELSRDEHLELIVVTGRAMARVEALKQAILARLQAQHAPPLQAVHVSQADSARDSPIRQPAAG
jgi:hypothetical protein